MPEINAGDTAWVLASAALVLLMTPGLAFFYGGLVAQKNAINTILLSFICLGLIGVQFVLVGYTLSFGPDMNGFIGGLDFIGLAGVPTDASTLGYSIPDQAFMIFQAMFAIITPALITGAMVERMKFSAFIIFILLWATLVYNPVAHWVWGGGFLFDWGALDFAGGAVVHVNAGMAALAAALVLGRRRSYDRGDAHTPHNVPFVVLGAGILWFGWFGFNAGSALGANSQAVVAFVATNTAAAAAAVAWTGISWYHTKKPSAVGAATGAVAGLVAITPAAGFVSPVAAIVIGVGAAVFCYLAVQVRIRSRFDDALDVWGVHGIGGAWGAIATGIFASAAVGGTTNGLLYGNPGQVLTQIAAVAVTAGYSFVMTGVILYALKATIGLRVEEEVEELGLDLAEHGEPAYT
jgi:Amt family ammonium transporter